MMPISVESEGLEAGRRGASRLKPPDFEGAEWSQGLSPRSSTGQADHLCFCPERLCKPSGVWPSPMSTPQAKRGGLVESKSPCLVQTPSSDLDFARRGNCPAARGLLSTGPAKQTRENKALQLKATHSPENTTSLRMPGCGRGPLCGFRALPMDGRLAVVPPRWCPMGLSNKEQKKSASANQTPLPALRCLSAATKAIPMSRNEPARAGVFRHGEAVNG
jgi:hypothetical protein